MANVSDRDRDLSNVLSKVEQDMIAAPPTPQRQSTVADFAPQKYRSANDSMEQIQQDFRKAITDLEQRTRALLEELKRITG